MKKELVWEVRAQTQLDKQILQWRQATGLHN